MEKTYEYIGDDDIVGPLRESFARALERRGYVQEVDVVGPGAPHVYEYLKGDSVISVVVDETAGEKWEARITVETEEADEDVAAVVYEAVLKLLADLSTSLIESISVESTRSKVASELRNVLATLE